MAGYRRGLRLPGGVVVVAGAGEALGGAVASALTGRGAHAVLLDGRPTRTAAPDALAVDLADADAVRDAARAVAARRDRLDGWVHCVALDPAGAALGALTELPPGPARVRGAAAAGRALLDADDVRRVLDVGVLGAVHGARAALPHLAAGGGVLLFVVGVHGQVARPYAAPQGMAHAAVRVLAGALRQELRLDGVRGVAVTAVLAPGLDARESRATGIGGPFPAGRCDRVAATVVDRLRHPGWEKVAGGAPAKAVVHGHALVPGVTEWLVARVAQRSRRRRGPKSDG